MGTNQPNPTPGEKATAQAKAALDEFRRRAAARSGVYGHPGITVGPGYGGPFGPGAQPFPFPGQPVAPDPGQPQAAGSLFESLGTMMRLSIDLVNSGIQGFIGAAGSRTGGAHRGGHEGCGCGCESCCDHFSSPHDCGCGCSGGCGCGCTPGVHNCR